MLQLTPEGQHVINDLAQQYQVSTEAVMSMLQAVIDGNGTMAQFNHSEFGGAGQWMQGGMTMVSDMFNHRLKSRVEGLCSALAHLLSSSTFGLTRPPHSQSQQQGRTSPSPGHRPSGPVSLFVPPEPGRPDHWWPDELGTPNSTGAQNNVRYAYFVQARRLAIEVNGHVTVYDTLDHHISGFSQQQSMGSSLSFSSQHGWVDVAQLPVITSDEITSDHCSQPAPVAAPESPATQASSAQPSTPEVNIFTAIEKLGELKARGLLTEEEFANKKADLLSRL
jgi:hypothetical protein